jgi:hypothetical protein
MYIGHVRVQFFLKKKDVFCGGVQKDKNEFGEKLFWSAENLSFYTNHKKFIFSRDFIHGHRMFRCTIRIIFHNFYILKHDF